MNTWRVLVGDVREKLQEIPEGSVQCVCTSPPYWGLRDYGTATWDGGDPACDHRRADWSKISSGQTQNSCRPGRTEIPSPQYGQECGKCGARRIDSQIGLEPTPDAYVQSLAGVFREVWRVLKDDGVCWVNLGSSYASGDTRTSRSLSGVPAYGTDGIAPQGFPVVDSVYSDLCDECLGDFLSHCARTSDNGQLSAQDEQQPSPTSRDTWPSDSASASLGALLLDVPASTSFESWRQHRGECSRCANRVSHLSVVRSSSRDASLCGRTVASIDGNGSSGQPSSGRRTGTAYQGKAWLNYTFKPKDLVPIPWMVAMALQAEGWYLRSDVIYSKPNPMPESVTDRPTKAHEYIFLLSKSERYFYDAEAIVEQATFKRNTPRPFGPVDKPSTADRNDVGNAYGYPESRNCRSVWQITTQPFEGAHFAVFPEAIPERCIKAGSRLGDTILDPFCGSGTTGRVALRLGRNFVGIELNHQYAELARERIGGAAPLFAVELGGTELTAGVGDADGR